MRHLAPQTPNNREVEAEAIAVRLSLALLRGLRVSDDRLTGEEARAQGSSVGSVSQEEDRVVGGKAQIMNSMLLP